MPRPATSQARPHVEAANRSTLRRLIHRGAAVAAAAVVLALLGWAPSAHAGGPPKAPAAVHLRTGKVVPATEVNIDTGTAKCIAVVDGKRTMYWARDVKAVKSGTSWFTPGPGNQSWRWYTAHSARNLPVDADGVPAFPDETKLYQRP